MVIASGRVTGAVSLFLLFSFHANAATYYVDRANGNDSNGGLSESDAFQSVSRVNSLALAPGDAVLFRRSQSFDTALNIDASGTQSQQIQFGAWGAGEPPVLYEIRYSGDYLVFQDFIVDHRKDAGDAVRIRNARNCTIRNMEIRLGTRDAIDIDGSEDILIDGVEIHHFLNGSYGSKDDSHGVAITDTARITIRNANIHHVSGDSVQADPNRIPGGISTDIVIEDSELWTSPLDEDFNAGWRAGNVPGENALDTKVLTVGFENEIRMNVTVRNVIAHGWVRVPEISNRAVFNLKEKINATMDRITVYDSEIAFRVRGSLGNADTLISNSVIYDVERAVRAEDDVRNLRIYFSTFGDGNGTLLELGGGSAGTPSWDWRNNAFVGTKPSVADHATNIQADSSDFVNSGQRNYRLAPTSRLIDAGEAIPGVSIDRDSITRSAPHDVGAFESGQAVTRPNPPVLDTE